LKPLVFATEDDGCPKTPKIPLALAVAEGWPNMLIEDDAATAEDGVVVCWPNTEDPEVELGCWPKRGKPVEADGIPNTEVAEVVTEVEVGPPNTAVPAMLVGAAAGG